MPLKLTENIREQKNQVLSASTVTQNENFRRTRPYLRNTRLQRKINRKVIRFPSPSAWHRESAPFFQHLPQVNSP